MKLDKAGNIIRKTLPLFLFIIIGVNLFPRGIEEDTGKSIPLEIADRIGSLPPEGGKGIISFEEAGSPENWMILGDGSLDTSVKHYKDGKQSLLWNFQKNSSLIALRPAGLSDAGELERGGIKGWIYSENPIDEKLRFSFGSIEELENHNPQYTFDFGLNFKGWRAFWVDFKSDAAASDAKENVKGIPLEAMLIQPPAHQRTGQVFLDVFEFTDIAWHRTADYQVPIIRAELDVELGGRTWERSYFWSQKTPTDSLPEEVTQEEKEAFRIIAERYKKWVFGSGGDPNSPAFQIRNKAFEKWIAAGVEEFEKRIKINKENGEIVSGTPLFGHNSKRRPRFGKDVSQRVFIQLALDYKINGNLESKQKALDLFDHFHDQGWAEGSALGTLDHAGNRMVGWVHAVYLMRDELKEAGKLARELAAMNWYLDFNETFELQMSTEVTSDNMRTYMQFRLLRILAMEDSPKKVQYMRGYLRWVNNILKVQPGYSGGIKPDYTIYHHRHAYYGAYGPHALHNAASVAWLLSGTKFALNKESVENIKQGLLTFRLIANKYDITQNALLGRFPSNNALLNLTLPAFAYIALASEPVDEEMARAFMRLYDLETDVIKKDLLPRVSSSIMFFDTLGAVTLMEELAAMDFKAEKLNSGHWVKPYANLSIHRRDSWMASIKGWSQYIWDFESSRKENLFGRYDSYGSIQILAGGNPVNAISSGYYYDKGWDWNRRPGATTIHLPLEKLKHNPYKKTALQPESSHRNFSDQTFVGGVSLENQNGMFAMQFHDPFFFPGFEANKSVFFFDNEIISLASDIKNNATEYNTETTLFQTILRDKSEPVLVNSLEPVNRFPYEVNLENTWLMDPVGNGYIIPTGEVTVFKREQTSKDHKNKKVTKGDYAVALINHGRAPRAEEYEYVILVQTTPERVKKYSEDLNYSVLQKDKNAHILIHKGLDITGYAIFNALAPISHGPVQKVSAPVLVMVKQSNSGMTLSLSDPDFRRPKQANMSSMPNKTVKAPSRMNKVQIILKDGWKFANKHKDVRILKSDENSTMIEFDCVDAQTYEVELIK